MEALTPDDPSRIGPYRLLGRLGAGGMGRVFLARSEGGRTVAVKLVRPELAEEDEFRRRFAQEVAAARRVGGEWTAPVLDADTDAREPWVATGYVPGPSLHAVIAGRPQPLPERSVRILAHRLAQALTAIHTAGLIHRDLKPANVLVTIDGPRVIDFGIARALDAVTGDNRTRTGVVIGSPGYMSPEQVRGETLTPASDVFSLGSVLAFAATRRQPFGTSTSGMHAVMFRIAQEEADLAGLPDGLADLVRRCLAKDPAERPTPAEVADLTADEANEGDDTDLPWLPGSVLADLGRRSAELLEAETPASPLPARPAGPPAPSTPPPPLNPPAPSTPPPPVTPPPTAVETPAPTPPPPSAPAPTPTSTPAPAPTPPPTATATPTPAPLGVFGAPTAVPEPRPARRRRTALVVASVVVAAALIAGGATYAVMSLGGNDGQNDKNNSGADEGSKDRSSDRQTPSDEDSDASDASGASAPPAVEGVIGKEYLGTWQGPGKNDDEEVSLRRLKITQGSVGADVVTTFNSFDDLLCEGAAKLVSFDNLMVLESRAVTSIPEDGCSDGGRQTVRANADGTLTWTGGDSGETAVLTRFTESAEPIPAGFLGTWTMEPSTDEESTSEPGDRTTLVLSQGKSGTVVAKYTGDSASYHCEWESVLVDAKPDGLRLGPQSVTASEPEEECDAFGSRTVKMKGTDALTLTWLDNEDEPTTYRRAD
ncbi:serine/threonine-protein kinase [Streptomyces sp. NPDC058155]|uniref:serine/threonine-protein kinase n=1 Tax=Streptomyces sp. NPDC058155 TaxID=3346359 RepID=UPI0036E078AD